MVIGDESEAHHQHDRHDDLRLSSALNTLDHATTWVETPVRRVAGSARLNPLPHAGTMSVFLLGAVVLSGLYITLFFEYGHSASYESVASMEVHAIQRVMRALHRYASAALVVTTVIHAWRIFTAQRFVGRQRRFRWATGVGAVALVWMAGVTGYWLVWDVRAQALNEVVVGFVGGTEAGTRFAIEHLGVLGGRSGSGFLLFMWFLHLGLTAAIGYFVFRHLRRSDLPWLPPRHMMAVMGAALALVSVSVPVGMLPPARPDRLVGEIPVDPFVLFLLPPLLSDLRWIVLGMALVAGITALCLPVLLRRHDPEVVAIDEEACTGCELCVIDCPYQALTMTGLTDEPPADERPAHGPLAVVDQQRCVGCGICLGSCAFGAIDLPGYDPTPPLDVAGRPLVIACDRHVDGSLPTDGPLAEADGALHAVGCAGAVAPQTIRLFAEQGATEVRVVGCAPNECRYGVGNTLAAERFAGERRPHPAPKFTRLIAQDWVAGDRVRHVLDTPGSHPLADGRQPPRRRELLVGAGSIAVATVIGVAFATRAPFDSQTDGDATHVRLVLDHRAGQPLQASPDRGPVGRLDGIELAIDDEVVAVIDRAEPSDAWVGIVDVSSTKRPDDDSGTISVYGLDGEDRELLQSVPIDTGSPSRHLVDMTDVPPRRTVADGQRIFNSRAGGCHVCHSVEPNDDGVGPSLADVASVAGNRVEGLSAEQYLRQSILLPDQYIVDGWPSGQMLPIYRDALSPEELDAVISYLLTLESALEQPPTEDSGSDS